MTHLYPVKPACSRSQSRGPCMAYLAITETLFYCLMPRSVLLLACLHLKM